MIGYIEIYAGSDEIKDIKVRVDNHGIFYGKALQEDLTWEVGDIVYAIIKRKDLKEYGRYIVKGFFDLDKLSPQINEEMVNLIEEVGETKLTFDTRTAMRLFCKYLPGQIVKVEEIPSFKKRDRFVEKARAWDVSSGDEWEFIPQYKIISKMGRDK